MGFRVETNGEISRVTVDRDVTIGHAAEFRDALVMAAGQAGSVVVDFSEAQSVDLTCVQLLCAAHLSCSRNGKRITLEGRNIDLLKKTACTAGFPRQCGSFLPGKQEKCLWGSC